MLFLFCKQRFASDWYVHEIDMRVDNDTENRDVNLNSDRITSWGTRELKAIITDLLRITRLMLMTFDETKVVFDDLKLFNEFYVDLRIVISHIQSLNIFLKRILFQQHT